MCGEAGWCDDNKLIIILIKAYLYIHFRYRIPKLPRMDPSLSIFKKKKNFITLIKKNRNKS